MKRAIIILSAAMVLSVGCAELKKVNTPEKVWFLEELQLVKDSTCKSESPMYLLSIDGHLYLKQPGGEGRIHLKSCPCKKEVSK